MDLGIEGRVAVVAASSRGLGFASATALGDEGARLVINGRRPDVLAEAAAQLRSRGAEVVEVVGDVASPELADRLVDAAIERFGRLDVVVANAGGPPPGRAFEVGEEALRAALEANLLASVRLATAGLVHLRQGGWGRICCITSYTIIQAAPMLALSNTARTGLWAWIKTAASDLAGSGITVNAVCPGLHATDRMVQLGATGEGRIAGDPADLGKVVAFLCSEPARFLSGARVVVDGGETLAL